MIATDLAEILRLENWIVYDENKIPRKIDLSKADPSNSDDFSSYSKAKQAVKKYKKAVGVGFCFKNSGYVGIDLDKCLVNGVLTEEAKIIYKKCDSYSEISPSGNGIHIIMKGKKPGKRCRLKEFKNFEMYDTDRYFTFTFKRFNDVGISHDQNKIDDVYYYVFGRSETKNTNTSIPVSNKRSFKDTLKKALEHDKFKMLWGGNWQEYTDPWSGAKFNSQSEADASLMSMIVFYWRTKDLDKISEIFSKSGLYRGDKKHKGYITITAKNAADYQTEFMSQSNSVKSFPMEIFPGVFQKVIKGLSEKLQYPLDFLASSTFFALACSSNNTLSLKVKEGWIEKPIYYMVMVGNPGTNKSHPIKLALNSFIKKDAESYSQYQDELDLHQMSKEKNTRTPFFKRKVITDYTPESVINDHKNNKSGLVIHVDEFIKFLNFDRYTKNNGDDSFWLTNWSGGTVSYSRKTTKSILIKDPFINVIGGIQPSMLGKLSENNRIGNGFLDRIIFINPDNTEYQIFKNDDPGLNTISEYESFINSIINKVQYKLSKTALSVFVSWDQENKSKILSDGDPFLQNYYAKLKSIFLRNCIVIASMWGEEEFIGAKTAEYSFLLTEYFRDMMQKTYRKLKNSNSPFESLGANKKEFFKALTDDEFSVSDAVTLGKNFSLSVSSTKRFLKNSIFFSKIKHGVYEKKF